MKNILLIHHPNEVRVALTELLIRTPDVELTLGVPSNLRLNTDEYDAALIGAESLIDNPALSRQAEALRSTGTTVIYLSCSGRFAARTDVVDTYALMKPEGLRALMDGVKSRMAKEG